MPDDPQTPPDHLYNVPIETLDLSESALENAKSVGLITIGRCLDIYEFMLDPDGDVVQWHPSIEVAFPEIVEKLKAQGYLPMDTSTSDAGSSES